MWAPESACLCMCVRVSGIFVCVNGVLPFDNMVLKAHVNLFRFIFVLYFSIKITLRTQGVWEREGIVMCNVLYLFVTKDLNLCK